MRPGDSGSAIRQSSFRPGSACVSIVRTTVDVYGERRGVPDLPDHDEALREKLTHAAHRFGAETLDGLKKGRGDDSILEVTSEPAFEFWNNPEDAIYDQL